MLTKAQNKYIRSLSQQKNRAEHGVFVIEGDKIAAEWLAAKHPIQMIIGLPQWIKVHEDLVATHKEAEVIIAEPHHLEAITGLQTPNQVLLVVHINKTPAALPTDEWCIALDALQDPGNMGTIIRIADWFGIKHIIASPGSADYYNPKVVQAAMGGHLRVHLHSMPLTDFFAQNTMPVLAATLDGDNIYTIKGMDKGVILIGNESKGVSPELIAKATQKITIPRKGGAESLNAGVSAGIICALLIRG